MLHSHELDSHALGSEQEPLAYFLKKCSSGAPQQGHAGSSCTCFGAGKCRAKLNASAEDAQCCDLHKFRAFKLLDASKRRTFLVRAVQLLPATRYTAAEKGDRLALGAHAEHSLALQVHAGATLEVTLAQVRSGGSNNRPAQCLSLCHFVWKVQSSLCKQVMWLANDLQAYLWWQHSSSKYAAHVVLCAWQLWSSLGESVLEVDVCFHGITATPSALFIDGGTAWNQTMIRRAHIYGAPHIDSRTGAMRASRQLHSELDLCSKLTASACIADQPHSGALVCSTFGGLNCHAWLWALLVKFPVAYTE